MERTKNDLAMLQALPLDVKLRKTQNRIREWVEYFGVDGVYVSFSGGYEYCIGGGEYVDGVWQPSKDGLGMGHVFDVLNELYGDGFIKY